MAENSFESDCKITLPLFVKFPATVSEPLFSMVKLAPLLMVILLLDPRIHMVLGELMFGY